jgi:hypothetical protein
MKTVLATRDVEIPDGGESRRRAPPPPARPAPRRAAPRSNSAAPSSLPLPPGSRRSRLDPSALSPPPLFLRQ